MLLRAWKGFYVPVAAGFAGSIAVSAQRAGRYSGCSRPYFLAFIRQISLDGRFSGCSDCVSAFHAAAELKLQKNFHRPVLVASSVLRPAKEWAAKPIGLSSYVSALRKTEETKNLPAGLTTHGRFSD